MINFKVDNKKCVPIKCLVALCFIGQIEKKNETVTVENSRMICAIYKKKKKKKLNKLKSFTQYSNCATS